MSIGLRQKSHVFRLLVVASYCARVACAFAVLVGLEVELSSAAPDKVRYRPDRVLLVPRKGVNENSILGLHAARGHRLLRSYRGLGDLQVVQLAPGEAVAEAIQRYRASGLVEMAEPDYKLKAFLSPNDPEFLNGTQ